MSGTKQKAPQIFGSIDVLGRTTLRDVLQLPSMTLAQANALAGPLDGMIIRCSNGNAGAACLATYNSGAWKVIALGATIS